MPKYTREIQELTDELDKLDWYLMPSTPSGRYMHFIPRKNATGRTSITDLELRTGTWGEGGVTAEEHVLMVRLMLVIHKARAADAAECVTLWTDLLADAQGSQEYE